MPDKRVGKDLQARGTTGRKQSQLRLENLCSEIPESLKEADELLRFYGRWAMTRRRIETCGSAEGNYRSPPRDEDRRAPREVLMTTDDAMAVQRALARVPDTNRLVLAILYIPKRQPVEAQLRMARIPPRLSRERHIDGLRMFGNIHKAMRSKSGATTKCKSFFD